MLWKRVDLYTRTELNNGWVLDIIIRRRLLCIYNTKQLTSRTIAIDPAQVYSVFLSLLTVTQIATYKIQVTVSSGDLNMVVSKLIQLYGKGAFKILFGLLTVTQ